MLHIFKDNAVIKTYNTYIWQLWLKGFQNNLLKYIFKISAEFDFFPYTCISADKGMVLCTFKQENGHFVNIY